MVNILAKVYHPAMGGFAVRKLHIFALFFSTERPAFELYPVSIA